MSNFRVLLLLFVLGFTVFKNTLCFQHPPIQFEFITTTNNKPILKKEDIL
jgi:hypothetical protein